jgi:hypothetical protein
VSCGIDKRCGQQRVIAALMVCRHFDEMRLLAHVVSVEGVKRDPSGKFNRDFSDLRWSDCKFPSPEQVDFREINHLVPSTA